MVLLISNYFQESDGEKDKYMCVNEDCLYHKNDEWICINKDCLYHNLFLDYDDENVAEFAFKKL